MSTIQIMMATVIWDVTYSLVQTFRSSSYTSLQVCPAFWHINTKLQGVKSQLAIVTVTAVTSHVTPTQRD
jgi:hypothetical protein